MKRYLYFPFLLASWACSATESTSPSDLQSRVSILEARMNEVSTKTAHGNFGAKTASASPQILGENWFFNADLLWWHVNEGGNDYALLYTQAPGSNETKVVDRKLKFKWDYGFRAGIGKTFQHDRWDLFLNFTWFRTDNSAASSLHGGYGLVPLLIIPINGASRNFANQVKIHWNIHFYTLDLNLGRHYFISPKVAVHPFVGLKTAWIEQHQRNSAKIVMPFLTEMHSKTKNRFWGIGPDFGVEGKWFIVSGFNLFGSIAGAILWGDFDVHQGRTSSDPNNNRSSIDFDLHALSPMTQMQIGFGYETNLHHNQYRLAVNARYEQQYFWGQNQIPYFPLANVYKYERFAEDLSLQGLTVDVRFDF